MTVLHIGGPRAVGTSTVGWELYMRLVGRGVRTGYVDLAQLRFHRPAPTDALVEENLAAVWRTYQDAGARALIVAGRPSRPLPGATLVWLRAERAHLIERLLRRGAGEGPPIPGDDLRGRPAHELRGLARELPVPDEADVVIDTSGRTASEVADAVEAALHPRVAVRVHASRGLGARESRRHASG